MKKESDEQLLFNAVITARIVMVYSGLKRVPNFEDTLKLAVKIGVESMSEFHGVDRPDQINWALYYVDMSEPDPVEAVMMPAWLVQGVKELTGDGNFDLGSIDPTAWTANIQEVLAAMPDRFADPSVMHILNGMDKSINSDPDQVDFLRTKLKSKQEALKSLRVNPTLH